MSLCFPEFKIIPNFRLLAYLHFDSHFTIHCREYRACTALWIQQPADVLISQTGQRMSHMDLCKCISCRDAVTVRDTRQPGPLISASTLFCHHGLGSDGCQLTVVIFCCFMKTSQSQDSPFSMFVRGVCSLVNISHGPCYVNACNLEEVAASLSGWYTLQGRDNTLCLLRFFITQLLKL